MKALIVIGLLASLLLAVLPTPGPEPWPEATATPPVVLDAPMARLCPAVTPAPVRVLRWTWRAE